MEEKTVVVLFNKELNLLLKLTNLFFRWVIGPYRRSKLTSWLHRKVSQRKFGNGRNGKNSGNAVEMDSCKAFMREFDIVGVIMIMSWITVGNVCLCHKDWKEQANDSDYFNSNFWRKNEVNWLYEIYAAYYQKMGAQLPWIMGLRAQLPNFFFKTPIILRCIFFFIFFFSSILSTDKGSSGNKRSIDISTAKKKLIPTPYNLWSLFSIMQSWKHPVPRTYMFLQNHWHSLYITHGYT